MSTIDVRVEKKIVEADGIVSLELHAAGDAPLPAFAAGAHVDIHLPNGLVRPYSLCNAPHDSGRYVIAVLREPNSRGGSLAVHETVQVGDVLSISMPKNHFPLVAAHRSILIGGGIGITPLLSMAQTLHASGSAFELHYCARAQSRTAFREHLLGSPFARNVRFYFDERGDAIDMAEVLAAPAQETHLYVCGPAGFIEFVTASAKRLGWPDGNVHFEFFAAPENPGEQVNTAFEIEIASKSIRLTVPEDRSVADVLLDNGIDIPVSCSQGVCGTCLTQVLSGTPEHRDMYLTDEEKARNDQFLPCCSRALSRVLVLDL
ncbi:PDR/VanB family oxidoreductase [Paraburkholderia silviterrae]|uniref:Oxidoreductase n=1 Tax=Paraburkholderia silviterrae TaxID=2528715 RepID=A0A4R5M0R3_9BURK|nr:PDR/VanB family oxidoreductase [Paraburkholderia silviterrae]TDG18801.1 oxidoreductase [Paraburkholderia silviterrae]